jgi:hypothetical protein
MSYDCLKRINAGCLWQSTRCHSFCNLIWPRCGFGYSTTGTRRGNGANWNYFGKQSKPVRGIERLVLVLAVCRWGIEHPHVNGDWKPDYWQPNNHRHLKKMLQENTQDSDV